MNLHTVVLISDTVSGFEGLANGARAIGANPVALFVGDADDAARIAEYGVRVICLGGYAPGARFDDCTDAFEAAINELAADVVLMGLSKRTTLVAGRLAVRMHAAVVTDAASVCVQDGCLVTSRPVYGGAAVRTEKISTRAIVLTGSGAFVSSAAEAGTTEIRSGIIAPGAVQRVGVTEKEEESVDLAAAKYIICVGHGIGSKENLDIISQYAATVGAEIGCTRPVAEGEGWLARNRYIGVSGAMVKPDVYLAVGVSGQVQHMVGVTDAKTIAVINKDKNAPIMKQCDLALIADIEKVVQYLPGV